MAAIEMKRMQKNIDMISKLYNIKNNIFFSRKVYAIEKIISHENYSLGQYEYDIALFKLKTEVMNE